MSEPALIVEDGTGKTNSESYASVADADTYFTARRERYDLGGGINRQQRESRFGTPRITSKRNTTLGSLVESATKDQALAFPAQVYIESYDGYAIESDEILRNSNEGQWNRGSCVVRRSPARLGRTPPKSPQRRTKSVRFVSPVTYIGRQGQHQVVSFRDDASSGSI